MKILVATHKHGLLPFAYRLKREGHDVEVLVFKDRYEKAWSGMFPKVVTGTGKNRESLTEMGRLAAKGEFVVLTDSKRGQEVFGGAQFLFGRGSWADAGPLGPIAVGGWFSGEAVVLGTEHFLVRDLGLWPGGLGPSVTGGVTLVRTVPQAFKCLLEGPVLEQLKSQSFRGLFAVDVRVEDEAPCAGPVVAGWDFLHTHAFVSDLDNLGGLLEGANGRLLAEHVVAIPVTIPPFPSVSNIHAQEVKVGGLEPGDLGSIFFHVIYTKGDQEVWTAGLDGLVAVVRGSGQNFQLALDLAVGRAAKLELPEKQFRPDVGSQVPGVLAMLENSGLA